MSYQGYFWRNDGNGVQAGRVSPSVQTGDLLVAYVAVTDYLLREGQTAFRPSDVTLPAGWLMVSWRVARAGGDPRRLAYVECVVGTIMTADSPRESLRPASAIPYYQADQDPGSAQVSWGPSPEALYADWVAEYWRGEKAVVAVEARDMAGAHALPMAGGSFAFVTWPWATVSGLHLMKTDDPSDVNTVPYPYAGVRSYAAEGVSTAYAWRSGWTGSSSAPYVSASVPQWTQHSFMVSTTVTPLAPTITLPASGALLDVEHAGLSLAWEHRGAFAGAQSGWALRITVGSTVRYWSHAAGALAGSPVINSGSLPTVELPSAAFPAGTGKQHALAVATCGVNQELSAFSDVVLVTGVLAPTATASLVGADLAGSLPSLRPQVQIGGVSSGATALVRWGASLVDLTNGREVATGSGAFVDGLASTVWAPDAEVDNGVLMQAVVRVQQSGGAWSAPVTAQATTSVSVPGVPTLAVSTGVHETSGAPSSQVRVDFPWETDGYGWEGRATLLRLERQDRGVWVTAAEILMPPGRVSAVLDDYSASAGALAYRARGEGQAADGSRLIGGWGYSSPTMLAAPGGWLIDPARPETAVEVDLVEDEARKIALRSVRMAAIGRDEELVAAGVPLLEEGSATVRVRTPEHRQRVLDLLRTGAVLKLTWCAERDIMGDGSRVAAETLWMRPVGDLSVARMTQGPFAPRHVQIDWVTQRPPVAKSAEVI